MSRQESSISFVQQKRMDDKKGQCGPNTHSRIFGWLEDHKDCADATAKKQPAAEPLPKAECGIALAPQPEVVVEASVPDSAPTLTVDQERALAASKVAIGSRQSSAKANQIAQSGLDWPPKEPTKYQKRQFSNKTASHI